MPPIQVSTFYKFASLSDREVLRPELWQFCVEQGIRGTILLATEGINGTIAGSPAGVEAVLAALRALPGFADMEAKHSFAAEPPFKRMKIRLKKEIVTLGVSVNPALTGAYVDPADWNSLLADPDVLLIDTRNAFEVAAGTFPRALDPSTKSFSEFPAFAQRALTDKKQKLALFCTGGIRCEKATSHLRAQGYENVWQLKGGILKYLEVVPEPESRWTGSCFVFDERVALDGELKPAHTR